MNHEDTKTQRGALWRVSPEAESAATEIVDAAFSVHSQLGPGLLESVYEACLARELELREVPVQRQVRIPLHYKGAELSEFLRLDLVVAELVVVEVKAVEALLAVHTAQMLSYLKLSGHRLGLLINFNVPTIKDGIRRLVL
jgi:GxxExxY protein